MHVIKTVKSTGLGLLIIAGFLLASCSSSPENLKLIPASTKAVSVIDIYSIGKKGKLDEVSKMKFFRTFKKEIRNENKRVARIIDELVEDPSLSGINFNNDLFAYLIDEAIDEKFICFSIEINDQEKFSEFIEDILDELEIDYDLEKEKNYTYALIDKEVVLGWDEDKAVLLIAENRRSRKNLDFEIEILMELDEKDQISVNKNFNSFYKNKKDISLWFSTDLFEDSYDFKNIEKQLDFELTDNYFSSFLNFEDESISLLTDFSGNRDVQKLLEENDIWDNSFNENLLSYFPEESFATVSFSLNPTACYDIFSKEYEYSTGNGLYLKDWFQSINGNAVFSILGFENVEYNYLGWGYGFNEDIAQLLDRRYTISEAGYLSSENKELLNQGKTIQTSTYNGRYCINIRNILDNGGSVQTAIENNSEINWYEGGWDYGKYIDVTKEEYLPLMSMSFDIQDDKVIRTLIKNIPDEIIQKRNNYFEFKINNRYPAYFTFNENTVFITNHKKSIKLFEDGGYSSKNLAYSSLSSEIKNNNLYSYINLNYEEYPKEIKKEIKNEQSQKVEKLFKTWEDFVKSVEIKKVNNTPLEIKFNTNSNGNNSLNNIITIIDNNY